MSDVPIAVAIALCFTCLLAAIEITWSAKSSLAGIFQTSTFLYLLIVSIGNTFTTLLAVATVSKQIPPNGPAWFWFAFIGVFGFEAILKHVNLTFAEIDFLSINDWITKAKVKATADVIESYVLHNEQKALELAGRLKQLSPIELNAHVMNILGSDQVQLLESKASQGNADPQLVKALALAKGNYKSALAISPKRNK